jgi:glycerol dehydrogenase-like iron-containing ADH family enzyme
MKKISSKISIPTILEVGNGVLEKIGKHLNLAGIEKVSLFIDREVKDLFLTKFEKGLLHFSKVNITEEYNEVSLDVNEICWILQNTLLF